MADIDFGSLLKVLLQAKDHHDTAKPEVVHDIPALANQAEGLGLGKLALQIVSSKEFTGMVVELLTGVVQAQLQKLLTRHSPGPTPLSPQLTIPTTSVSPQPNAPPTPPTPILGPDGRWTLPPQQQLPPRPPVPVLVNGVWVLPHDANVYVAPKPPEPVLVDGLWTLPNQPAPGHPVLVVPGSTGGQSADSFGLNVEEVFGPNRTGRVQRKFRVDPDLVDGHYNLVMLKPDGVTPDDTTSLDDQSGVFLAGITFLRGKTVKVEEVPGVLGKLYWKIKNIDTGEENKLSLVNGVWTASNNEHSTNWRTDGEIVNSQGYAATVHFHDKASGYDITFGQEGVGEADPIRTPEVR